MDVTPGDEHRAEAGLQVIVDRGPLWGRDSNVPIKLPWNDPDFSRRMLAEHLDQSHDMASRRTGRIERQVDWIFGELLGDRPGAVLDLGCGPGLYTQRLAERGCRCVGIDFSPASIAHAATEADAQGLDCVYRTEDLGTAALGAGYDLAMILFGELNTFDRGSAADLLARAARAVVPGGVVLAEVHTHDSIVRWGRRPASWYSAHRGVFSDAPHVVLTEQVWNDEAAATRARYIVIHAEGKVSVFGEELAAYTDDDYRTLMTSAGLTAVEILPGMGQDREPELQVLAARRPARVD